MPERFRRFVGQEGGGLCRCRRQSGQVEGRATDQGAAVRRRILLQTLLPKPGKHKPVHRIFLRSGSAGWGNHPLHRLEGPVFPAGRHVDARVHQRSPPARIRRPQSDPLLQGRDLFRSKGLLRRHLKILVETAHRLHQETRFGITRHDHRSLVPAFLPTGSGVQTQPSLLFGFTVAFLAVFNQERTDRGFKKLPTAFRPIRAGERQPTTEEDDQTLKPDRTAQP